MAVKLKPVVYTTARFKTGAQNTFQQLLLIKALKVTQDPEKLRQMIGVRTVAEVFRTLDKLAMRREYHEAMSRSGVTFDFLVGGLKAEAINGEKSADRIKAYQVLLKSLGLDQYKESENSTGTWEETLLKTLNKKEEGKNKMLSAHQNESGEYEVAIPEIPKEVQAVQEEEDRLMKGIYD